jgi:hypothetical protein
VTWPTRRDGGGEGTDDGSRLGELLRHPWTAVTTGLAVVSSSVGVLDPVFGVVGMIIHLVGATAQAWFPLLGVLSSLGQGLAFIPAATAQQAFYVGGAVYALYLSDRLLERLWQYLTDQ